MLTLILPRTKGKFGLLLDDLISIKPDTELHDPRIPEFITHMLLRTKHLRDSLRTPSEYMIKHLSEYLSDFENQKRLMLRNINSLQSQIDSTLEPYNATPFQKELVHILLPHLAPLIMDQHKVEIQIVCNHFFSLIKNNLPKFLKDAHIKALMRENGPDIRVQRYRSLNWYVSELDRPVILET